MLIPVLALSGLAGIVVTIIGDRWAILMLLVLTLICALFYLSIVPIHDWLHAQGCDGHLLKVMVCPEDVDTSLAFPLGWAGIVAMMALVCLVPATFASAATLIYRRLNG